MDLLEQLREQIRQLGPLGKSLLPELDRIEKEFDLRARRIAALSSANQITAAIARIDDQGDVDQVLDRILLASLAVTGAERGMVILREDNEDGFRIVASRQVDQAQADGEEITLSRSLIRQILERGEPIATTNVQQDDRFEAGASLLVSDIRSVMAVPIRPQDEVIGGVYVDSRLSEQHFGEADVKTFTVFADNAAIALNLATSFKERRELYLQSVLALVNAVEAADPYTAGHGSRVGYYATEIARKLGYEDQELELITIAGYLHDIGKIAMVSNVSKTGSLTDAEWEEMRKHPVYGERILRNSPALAAILPAVRSHHEKWTGGGYPDGISGEEIHPYARIMAVADVFDALTTDRPYRRADTVEEAVDKIRNDIGSHFEPASAEAFVALIDAGELKRAERNRPDFETYEEVYKSRG